MLAASLAGETGIADNFDGADMLEADLVRTDRPRREALINVDPVGAFRFFARPANC